MSWERRDLLVAAVLAIFAITALVTAATSYGAGEYEPNDSRETAAGPLAGGTDYVATFETNNDVDWYVFYLKAYSQMDFSAGTIAGCGEAHFNLLDKDGKELQSFHAGDLNEVGHLRTTLPAGRYYFEVLNHGCVGDGYKFRLDPGAAVTVSRVCGEVIVARDSVTPELTKLGEKLGYINSVVAKRTARVGSEKKQLKRLKAHRASRYSKQSARRELAAAKASLNKALEKKLALETLGGQFASTLTTANSQIAGSC